MDDNQRLQLQSMIQANDTTDQTDMIRRLKHSAIMRREVNKLIELKSANNVDAMMTECNFLFTYYTDIYNKLRKDEIDVAILIRFLDILQKIELGDLDQHEGSFQVGTILKELYIDSALKKADKLNVDSETVVKKAVHIISWRDYKHKRTNILSHMNT